MQAGRPPACIIQRCHVEAAQRYQIVGILAGKGVETEPDPQDPSLVQFPTPHMAIWADEREMTLAPAPLLGFTGERCLADPQILGNACITETHGLMMEANNIATFSCQSKISVLGPRRMCG